MVKHFTVTPWEVKGKVDYDRLIKDFGLQTITNSLLKRLQKHTGKLHFMLRRGIFFAHRDLNWLLDEYEKDNRFYLYTGRGPSGKTHIGHLIPWIFTKWLQDKFNAKLYFQMTNDEKFLFKKNLTLKNVEKFTYENILDVIAIGFNPKKTKIIRDIEDIELLYKEALKVARHLTFSTVKGVFGFKESSNVGQIFFTCIQAVPAFLESTLTGKNVPCLIPLAVDQDPHFRIARDIAPKIGYFKPAIIHSKFLPSLTGPGEKMSSSEPETCIFTTDNENDVKRKIGNSFTGGRETAELQHKYGGNPDICSVFSYYFFLFEQDDRKLNEIRKMCKSGKILCGECKARLIEKIIKFLKEHQKRREKAKNIVDKFIVNYSRLRRELCR